MRRRLQPLRARWRSKMPGQEPCPGASWSLLGPRQHLLDHHLVVHAALVDLAVDGEDPQHAALRRRVIEARVAAEARQDGDILLAVELVGDGRGVDAGAGLELPQLLAGLGVIGEEATAQVAGEENAAL